MSWWRASFASCRRACGSANGCRLGLSTCVAYSRGQNLSLWLAESRRCLIWWSRTLDTLSTVGMCPVVAAASAGWVLLFATCRSFDLRGVFTRPKPVVVACRGSSAPDLVVEDPRHVGNRRNVPGGRRCVRRMGSALRDLWPYDQRCVFTRPKPVVLACRESFPPDLVVEDPRHVVNRRNVPGGRRCVRSERSSSPRVHVRPPRDRAVGAGRGDMTFAIRRSTRRGARPPNQATTALAETKRQVLISGKRSAGRKTKAAPVRSAGRCARPSPKTTPGAASHR
jgi:hypothetical protein